MLLICNYKKKTEMISNKSSNPNNKLYLFNWLYQSISTTTTTISINSHSSSLESKIQKLESEKLNLEYQVKLLKTQLNVDLISMMQHNNT